MNKNGLEVQNTQETAEPIFVESNVGISAAGVFDDEPAAGISAEGNVWVIENGTVDGSAGVIAYDGATVIVDPTGSFEYVVEQEEKAETFDDLKALTPEEDVKAVTADKVGVFVGDGSKVAVVGDVSVESTDSDYGAGIQTGVKPQEQEKPASGTDEKFDIALVAGDLNVSVTPTVSGTSADAKGIEIANDEDNSIMVTGDVNVKTESKDGGSAAYGVYAVMSDGQKVDVLAGGELKVDVDVTSPNHKGDVYPEVIGTGISANISGEGTSFDAGAGSIEVTADSDYKSTNADGVQLKVWSGASASLNVQGDVTVKSTSKPQEDEQKLEYEEVIYYDPYTSNNTNGLNVDLVNGTVNAYIAGDINADAFENGQPSNLAAGILLTAGRVVYDTKRTIVLDNGKELDDSKYVCVISDDGTVFLDGTQVGKAVKVIEEEVSSPDTIKGKGTFEAEIGGNVKSSGFGLVIEYATDDTETQTNITVGGNTENENGSVYGSDAAILINNHVTEDSKLNITVWELNTVNIDGKDHAVVTYDENHEIIANETTSAVEKKINYLIKVEQNANGSIDTNGRETANQDEKVVVKLNPNAGYHVTATYDDFGKLVPMTREADGTYSFVVPCGGGIYLSAVFDPDDNGDSWERTVTTVNASVVLPETANAGSSAISAEDAAVLSHYSPEQQVAIILTKLGMGDALAASGIRIKDLARKAEEGITSDLSSLVTEEELTIDGVTAVWKVISLMENGKMVKYCFRQLEDGTWVFKKI